MNTARSDLPIPRARARTRAAQRREQERAARKKERSIRRRERREQRSEEFWLREQQGLSSPGTSEYSSSGEEEEEEESDGSRAPPERWEPSPPLAQSRGGGGRDDAWGGRRSACRQATYERGDAHRGGTGAHREDGWGCGGGRTGGGYSIRRAPEEKETRVFHPEVGNFFPSTAFLDRLGPTFLAFVFAGWRPPCPLLCLPRC
jgi:hypothetical protein